MSRDISSHDRDVLNHILGPFYMKRSGTITTEEDLIGLEGENVRKAKCFEYEGVHLAEEGDILGAIDKFTSAINIAPDWASSYNNRAQARRLKHDIEGALNDLSKAISKSERRGRVAMQAFTQRAMIHHLNGDTESARADYQEAADLGCEFARTQIVALNPYAALCSQMLSEVIGELQHK